MGFTEGSASTTRQHANKGGIDLYKRMKEEGLRPTNSAVIAALKECGRLTDLREGRKIHSDIGLSSLSDVYVANTLLAMYTKCKSLGEARSLFDKMLRHTVVSWNTIILAYAEAGEGHLALELYSGMQNEHCRPDRVTFLAALKACASAAVREKGEIVEGRLVKVVQLQIGREIHSQVVSSGYGSDNFVANTLLAMYSKCRSLAEARAVFDGIKTLDVVSWNAMILAYAEQGEGRAALEIFSRMQRQSACLPDAVTYLAALKACYSSSSSSLAETDQATLTKGDEHMQECLENGRMIHSMVEKAGLGRDVALANTLVVMYARGGSLPEAREVFDGIRSPTVVSWNGIIQGYAEAGDGETALELFVKMKVKPDKVTYLAAIKACSTLAGKLDLKQADGEERRLELLNRGRDIHRQAELSKVDMDEYVANGLLTMYSRCRSMPEAQSVFDKMPAPSLVSWNALILGFTDCGMFEEALELFERLENRGIFTPDKVTFLAALKACTGSASSEPGREVEGKVVKIASLGRGRRIHSLLKKTRLEHDRRVVNSLITMYARCGCMTDARSLFDRAEAPDVVSWTALITGYSDADEPLLALQFFQRMRQEEKLRPDKVTYLAALKACASLADLETGRDLHGEIRDLKLDQQDHGSQLANSLIDLYGKCGSMREAEELFGFLGVEKRNLVSWNALIAGYSRQGDYDRVLEVFERLLREEERLKPDEVTFLSVLTSCSRAGLVKEGVEALETMKRCGLKARVEHYACVVDVLGRTNHLELAAGVIRSMDCEANVRIWMTLLDACAKWGNACVGKVAFDEVMRIDTRVPAAYVLIANIYNSSAGRRRLW